MNMKQVISFITLIAVGLFAWTACNDYERVPVDSDPTVPGQVSNAQVERLPGAIKLTYNMPDDPVLSYIQAECLINGTLRQVKSSAYQNNLTIEGFADTAVYQVNLYSVSRSEVLSKPVVLQVKPKSPPFQDVFKNISLIPDFGGATVTFKNPDEADLAITLMYIDSLGYWTNGETTYTSKLEGQLSLRNMDTIPTVFGVYIRDRWNNMTDTLVQELTPIYEQQLDRLKVRPYVLPTDEPPAFGWTLDKLWDGLTSEGNGFHTGSEKWPQWVTFDLGVTAKFSRFRWWQRKDYGLEFADRNVKTFEVWGSNNPNLDGSWDSWTYLLTAKSVKPSGLPIGQLSDEDRQLIADGQEHIFPADVPACRYIRLKVTETWIGSIGQWFIMELAFWGAIQK
jgi:hypothetical protein